MKWQEWLRKPSGPPSPRPRVRGLSPCHSNVRQILRRSDPLLLLFAICVLYLLGYTFGNFSSSCYQFFSNLISIVTLIRLFGQPFIDDGHVLQVCLPILLSNVYVIP
jgi:hypothetical protein